MEITKPFWYRKTGSLTQLYTYPDPLMVRGLAEKYGGKTVPSINVTMDIYRELASADLCSIIENDSPEIKPSDLSRDKCRYAILVDDGSGFTQYGERHLYLKQANDVAKGIARFYQCVLVIKRRVTNVENS